MRLTILSLLLLSCLTAMSQDLSPINKAISNGQAEELSKFFNQSIDISIDGSEGIYNPQQAEALLAKFFNNNPPSSYNVKHKGGSKSNSKYVIGELLAGGKEYRSHLLYQVNDNTVQIIELRFELED